MQTNNIKTTKYHYLIAAFVIPFAACMYFLALKGVYPFGNRCILQSDMYDQYSPFFYHLGRILKSGEFSLYDWDMGLGADFISTYSYYLSSPLNFLLFFVPEKYIIEFMTYSIVLRIGLCGLNFYLFLRYRFELDDLSKENRPTHMVALLLSTTYALSGYVAAYNWQIMWMDCIALAPLIFLGLLKMHRERKATLYFLTLVVAIFSNYYIAMMICVFLVFYWLLIVYEEENRAERLRFSMRFLGYSLLAGGAAACIILPTVSDLSNSGSDATSFPEKLEWFFSPLAALSRGNAYANSYSGAGYWPNIYAGVFTLLLVLAFFFCKDISIKRKIPRFFMLLFFQLSFMNNILSYLWHGFRQPTCFPARQSFLYIFMLLSIGMEGYLKRAEVKKKQLYISFGVLLFLVFLSAFAKDNEISGWYSYSITGLLILIYAILYLLITYLGKETKNLVFGLIILIAFWEVMISMKAGSFTNTVRDEYVDRIEEVQQLLKEREEEDLYRTDMPYSLIRNDGPLIGYSSLSVFNTVLNKNIVDYYSNNLMRTNIKSYTSRGITPIVAAMLGERYYIDISSPGEQNFSGDDTENEDALRKLVSKVGDYCLYENKYYLPIAFTIPESVVSLDAATSLDASTGKDASTNLSVLTGLDAANDSEVATGIEEATSLEVATGIEEAASLEVATGSEEAASLGVETGIEEAAGLEASTGSNAAPNSEAADPLVFLNELPLALTGKKAYTNTLDFIQNDKDFGAELIIEEEGFYYLQNENSSISELTLVFPDGQEKQFRSTDSEYLMEIGYLDKNDKLIATNPEEYGMSFHLYRADLDVISETVEVLGRHPFAVSKKEGSLLEGSITVEEGEKVFFSIPFDKGWRAFVDGEEVAIEGYYGAFICLSPQKGEHTIRLIYEVPYLKIGTLISLICISLGVISLLLSYFDIGLLDNKFRKI